MSTKLVAIQTLRKKEGDRAHDPAQITDAATRYNVFGRIKPNREGLTINQMVEAIRAAGYSPHSFSLGNANIHIVLDEPSVYEAVRKIHPYIESEIPVILILAHPSGWHAVVAIGHSWNNSPHNRTVIERDLGNGLILNFSHAVNWVPDLIIHNDNSGPYLTLPKKSADNSYALEHGVNAIPLLPADVFMSAEEAFAVGMIILENVYAEIRAGKGASDADLLKSSQEIAFRLLLVEKRKLRSWAADQALAPELQSKLRLMDLPKRIWVFELHLKNNYGAHGGGSVNSLVGFILIDPTGDQSEHSVMLLYMNLNYPNFGFQSGIIVTWDKGLPQKVEQVSDKGPLYPMRS